MLHKILITSLCFLTLPFLNLPPETFGSVIMRNIPSSLQDQIEKVAIVLIQTILQFSSSFLEGIADYVAPTLPFISLSKGLELNTLRTMSQIIPQSLRNSRQPFIALSGPSFAQELMNKFPTGLLYAQRKVAFIDTLFIIYLFVLYCLWLEVT